MRRVCSYQLLGCCAAVVALGLAAVGSGQEPPSKDLSVRQLRRAAEKGGAEAQYGLGWRLERGSGVTKDVKQAANWFTKAVAQNHLPAMIDLARLYAAGQGLAREPGAAKPQIDALLEKSPALIKAAQFSMADKAVFFWNVTKAYFNGTTDREPAFAKVRAVVAREAPDSSLLHTVEGQFYTDYAWDARTGAFANEVTAQQFQRFRERLKLAAAALEKAWQLDNKNSAAATSRITVAMGQQEKRADMERWFDRAKQADPNNLAAYRAKMMYLEPKWGGSGATCWRSAANA